MEQILEQAEEHKHGSRTTIFDMWHNGEAPATTWKEFYLWWRSTEVRELDHQHHMLCFGQPFTATQLKPWSISSSSHLNSGFSNTKNYCPFLIEFLNWNSCARKFWIKTLSGYSAGQGLAVFKGESGKGIENLGRAESLVHTGYQRHMPKVTIEQWGHIFSPIPFLLTLKNLTSYIVKTS